MKVGGTFREFLSTEKLSPDSHFAVGSRVELQKSTQWSRPQGRPQSGFSIVVVLIAILLFSNTSNNSSDTTLNDYYSGYNKP